MAPHSSTLAWKNPMDGWAWWAVVHGVAKSQRRLSNFTFTFHFYALEKEMATHSSVRAWRIPGTGEPRWLPFTGSHRVRHDWSDLAAAAGSSAGKEATCKQEASFNSWVRKIPWRRDRLPTPVFLGFLADSDDKESACNAGDPGLIPGSGSHPGEGIGYPLQYSQASLVAQLAHGKHVDQCLAYSEHHKMQLWWGWGY